MEECMKQSGHAAQAKAEERMNRRLAEHIEEQESNRQKVTSPAAQEDAVVEATTKRKADEDPQ